MIWALVAGAALLPFLYVGAMIMMAVFGSRHRGSWSIEDPLDAFDILGSKKGH